MKKIKTIASAIIMIIVGTTNTFSQDHKHETSAHGGRIQDANGYHVELLNKNGYVAVYLLDNNAKPMSNKNITGNIILQFSDKTSTTVELTPKDDDGFSVKQ
jgi:nitrogen fixation protein FixH